ncbi:MAG: hypothetical protein SGJ13_03415 [Actinomycetota bacterium]|nr:hypothetical protein [Actinomycetota bacterium]
MQPQTSTAVLEPTTNPAPAGHPAPAVDRTPEPAHHPRRWALAELAALAAR